MRKYLPFRLVSPQALYHHPPGTKQKLHLVQLILHGPYSLYPCIFFHMRRTHVHHVCMCCTCEVVGTVGIRMVVIVPVLGGKHHSCVVAHGVSQISRQICEVNSKVAFCAIKVKSVFNGATGLFPIFQLDMKDRVALSS